MSDAQRLPEPLVRELVHRRPTLGARPIGVVRLPVAGPYRPAARLYRLPDGRLLWHVRLWEYYRAVPHIVGTTTLIAFARRSGLPALEREVQELVQRATERGRVPE